LGIQLRNVDDTLSIKNELFISSIAAFVTLLPYFAVKIESLKNVVNPSIPYADYILVFLLGFEYIVTWIYPTVQTFIVQKAFSKLSEEYENFRQTDSANFSKDTLVKVLEDTEHGIPSLEEFLKADFSSENILFYKDVLEFEKIVDENARRICAEDIVNNYIKEDGYRALNIDIELRENIIQKYQNDKEISNKFFEKVKDVIFTLILHDSFPRYVQSTHYTQMAIKLDWRRQSLNSAREVDMI